MALSIPESPVREKAGLYVLDLDTGVSWQILTDYYVWEVRAAPAEISP
jgi:hypothetical protein